MVTDHRGRAAIDQLSGVALLVARRCVLVLVAPVDDDEDRVVGLLGRVDERSHVLLEVA